MLSRMDKISVMCMMAFVKNRASMRYTVESRTAAAATKSSRYTVCLYGSSELCEGGVRGSTHLFRVTWLPVSPSPPTPPPRPPCLIQSERTMAEMTTKPAN